MKAQNKLDLPGNFFLMHCFKTLLDLPTKQENEITQLLDKKTNRSSYNMNLDKGTLSRELYRSCEKVGYQILASLGNAIVDVDRKKPDIALATKYLAKFKYLYFSNAGKTNSDISSYGVSEKELNTLAFKTLVNFIT
uniref:hypothetical protein n=1 Tax=Chrysotila carterae TaxID=13221 RepID=UPI0022F2A5B6|nr:hypothetical protein PKF17_pgp016 [Chrysotila carterae]WAK83233.1 hypothetical protein [Chrysotila carterae]